MQQKTSRFETAVDTFMDSSGLSRGEAESYVLRELDGFGRNEAAQRLDKDPSTVDTLLQRGKKKKGVRLPGVSKIETTARVGSDDDPAVVIWFENQAQLQYRWDGEEIVEETKGADDPHTVVQSWGVGGGRDELAEFALESLAEYINTYQTDIDACRHDWPDVFEAITLYEA